MGARQPGGAVVVRLADPRSAPRSGSEFANTRVRERGDAQPFVSGIDEFPVKSTRRQFERYVDWWGHPHFAAKYLRRAALSPSDDAWDRRPWVSSRPREQLVKVLERRPHAAAVSAGTVAPLAGGGERQPRARQPARRRALKTCARRHPYSPTGPALTRPSARRAVLRHRGAARRPWRLSLDRIRRRHRDASLADRLRNPSDVD